MTASSLKSFDRDQRGAVMVTGLCMSLFLIGALWYLIGIGDAIVFRDKMQEVSDHAAFTSASIHARGMNLISGCNIILLVLFVIHIIMGIVHDILLIVTIYGLGIPYPAYEKWRQVWVNYAKTMKKVATTIHYVEFAAAYGYPYAATYEGYALGKTYDEESGIKRNITVIPISTSLIPGAVMNMPLNAVLSRTGGAAYKTTRPKAALPVQAREYLYVCRKIGREATDTIMSTATSMAGPLKDPLKRMFGADIGGMLQARYCNKGNDGEAFQKAIEEALKDMEKKLSGMTLGLSSLLPKVNVIRPIVAKLIANLASGFIEKLGIDPGFDKWWGYDGPFVPWQGAGNGSPWYQVWAINVRPEYKDTSEKIVALAQRRYDGAPTVDSAKADKGEMYYAQAEFYFDCKSDWKAHECNGRNGDDNAGYAMKWRARLRRLEAPGLGTLMVTWGFEFLRNMKGYRDFKKTIGDKLGEKVGTIVGGSDERTRTIVGGGVEQVVDQAFRELEDLAKGIGKDSGVGKGIDRRVQQAAEAMDPRFGGSFH